MYLPKLPGQSSFNGQGSMRWLAPSRRKRPVQEVLSAEEACAWSRDAQQAGVGGHQFRARPHIRRQKPSNQAQAWDRVRRWLLVRGDTVDSNTSKTLPPREGRDLCERMGMAGKAARQGSVQSLVRGAQEDVSTDAQAGTFCVMEIPASMTSENML